MLSMPFFVIWSIGTILDLEMDYLVKMGLFVVVYLVVNGTSILTFDERLMNFLPLGIYFATKICVYYTWFLYIQLYVSPLTTVTFVLGGTALWYCFWKAWKSDPGMRLALVLCLLIFTVIFVRDRPHQPGGEVPNSHPAGRE